MNTVLKNKKIYIFHFMKYYFAFAMPSCNPTYSLSGSQSENCMFKNLHKSVPFSLSAEGIAEALILLLCI